MQTVPRAMFVVISLLCVAPVSGAERANANHEPARRAAKTEKKADPCVSGSYKLVKTIGAAVRAVLVSSSCRNEASMRALGDRLKMDFGSESIVTVEVFDNISAAKMDGTMESRTPKETAFYDRHYIGNYSKNINTGNHQYTILLDGPDGPPIEVQY